MALSVSVLNTVSGIEGLDLQLMPASFKILQADFSWALQDLGALVFYQVRLLPISLARRASSAVVVPASCPRGRADGAPSRRVCGSGEKPLCEIVVPVSSPSLD